MLYTSHKNLINILFNQLWSWSINYLSFFTNLSKNTFNPLTQVEPFLRVSSQVQLGSCQSMSDGQESAHSKQDGRLANCLCSKYATWLYGNLKILRQAVNFNNDYLKYHLLLIKIFFSKAPILICLMLLILFI